MQHPFRHFFPGCFPRASHKFRRSRYLIQRFCGNPNTSFNCGSSRTLRTRAMVSPGVCDWSVSTPIISRTANAGRLSLLRFKAERTDDEWNSSRSCRIVADSVVGRKFSHTKLCDSFRASTMGSELMQKQRGQNSGGSSPEWYGDCARRARENPAQAGFRRGVPERASKIPRGPG
jgi:hypothetical protein